MMKCALFAAALFLLSVTATTPAQDALEQGFQSPPTDCRPGVFMDWMGGQLSKEGLKKDFEALAQQGIGGVLVMQMPDQLIGVTQWPFRDYPGKIKPVSDEWFETVNYAIGECDRLGLTFSSLPCPGWSHVGGPWVTPEKGLKVLVGERTEIKGPARFDDVIPRAEVHYEKKPTLPAWSSDAEAWKKVRESYGDYYRDTAVIAYPAGRGAVPQDKIIDLTDKMDAEGRLTWDVPEGTWTVVRLGCATHKGPNYPAPVEGAGLECDRMDPEAVRLVFDNYVGRIVREAKAKGYDAFAGFDTDSYESGFQDFSEDFPAEFKKRMGYDCAKWLPAWHNRQLVIGNADLTNRFRRDMLQVVSDLWLERFYGEIKRFAEANGINWMVEPYFLLNIDWRTVAARSHLPGSEFWIRDVSAPPSWVGSDLTGPGPDSAALYGQKIVWAEAFTAGGETSAWRNDPWLLKPYGDAAFCRGINQFFMHGFTHNPFGDHIQPGLTMGFWGTQMNRHLTWWPYSSAWHRYLARCQFMLRQGLPVADVLSYPPRTEHIPRPLLDCAPYKEVVSNDETLVKRLSVKDGRLVLPHGVSYAALAIPSAKQAQRSMTPEALKRILELVNEGATLIAEPVPARSVSMVNYPECDKELARLVAQIWGNGETRKQGVRPIGRGRVIWGRPLIEMLDEVAGGPDFRFESVAQFEPGKNYNPRYDFVHRRTSEAEVYFIANPRDEAIEATAHFRVTGRKPQLWCAVTGRRRPLPEYNQSGSHTAIPMKLAARQSFFVVFPSAEQVSNVAQDTNPPGKNFPDVKELLAIDGTWQVAFDPKRGGPAKIEFAGLDDWSKRPEEAIKYYSGTATYTKTFDLRDSQLSTLSSQLYLDLGKVKNLARVRLNGRDLGVVWCEPWRVNVGGALKEKGNQLEIDVVNTWVNRIIGDEQLPADMEMVEMDGSGYKPGVKGRALKDLPDWLVQGQPRPTKRTTFYNWQFYPKDAPLSESGLLGPVRLMVEE
jgi:hypothetical protein